MSVYPRLKRVTVTSLDGRVVLGTAAFGTPGLTLDETGLVYGSAGQSVRKLRDVLADGGVDIGALGFTYSDRTIEIRPTGTTFPRVIFADLTDEFVQFLGGGTVQVLPPLDLRSPIARKSVSST